MVIPSRPWQGAPAARAPLHPHRQTGLSDSPFVCPDASVAGSANRSGDHRSRCNVWPLHHQSGGAFLLPRHPHDEGSFRAPLNPIEHGRACPLQPCPHRISNASAVDCSAIEQLSPWRIVYPLVTLQPCQGKTPAFGFGWNARCTNSSCRRVDPMIDPPRKCSVNSCAITSRRMPVVLNRQRDKQAPNRQKNRLGTTCKRGLRPPPITMPNCSHMS